MASDDFMASDKLPYLLRLRLTTLECGLREAKSLYFDGNEREDWDYRRLAARSALMCVIDFLDSIPEFKQEALTLPLFQLITALHEIDELGRPAMLEVSRPRGRRPDPAPAQVFKGQAAAAVRLLMLAGRSKDEAVGEVTLAVNRTGYRPRGVRERKVRPGTVAEWLDKASDKRANDQMATTYRRTLGMAEQQSLPPVTAAARLLDGLARWVRLWNLDKSPFKPVDG